MGKIKVLLSLLGIPIFGAALSFTYGDWTWFARSGSVMVAFSILDFAVSYSNASLNSIFPYLRAHTTPDQLTDDIVHEASHEKTIERLQIEQKTYFSGVAGAFFGTLIWGFGDLVNLFL